jgi:serine/threonine protein kinase
MYHDGMVGRTLGHHTIVSEIGRGGMGVVYRAYDEVLRRPVALKILTAKTVADKPARDFLLHEARASSALNHPNVCTVHDVGEIDGDLYIVMELIEGQTLSTLIESTDGGNGLPTDQVLRYGVQISAALAHAHGRNIVHRDLKSHNIAVTAEGLVKVLDFGLARRLPGEAGEGATMTISPMEGSSAMAGTLAYMAPEILRGAEGDARSDIWALGVVLYEIICGQKPFHGKTQFEVSASIMNDVPPLLPAISPMLRAIVQRCLAKDPAERYHSAGEVRAALEASQSAAMAAPALSLTSAFNDPMRYNRPASFDTPTPTPRTDPAAMDSTPQQIFIPRGVKHLSVKNGDMLLLVGTTKGLFLMRSNAKRAKWEIAGPYFHGQGVYTMAYDARAGRRRIWASTKTPMSAVLRWTDDFGRTWTNPSESQLQFPAGSGATVQDVWQVCPGRDEEPEVLYCGVAPAALFESRDGGHTWSLVRGLFDHPHRIRWEPGNGGLCLHTIVLDPVNPARRYVAISAAGVYRTEDDGKTWQAKNHGIRVTFRPERYPEFGQCVHRIVMHPARPERLFLQNHWGLYRSDDAGESWQDIANGVPSDFGFAMAIHPRHPDWVYTIPVESDEFRCTPEGRLRVYRTRNAGESWEALSRGLPQKGSYTTVLRHGMTTDTLDPPGVYFGTRHGIVYGSIDEGKTWKKIVEGLPAITCVSVCRVGSK